MQVPNSGGTAAPKLKAPANACDCHMHLYDAARFPADIFRGFLAVLFTFIIPLALMTTWPSRALLGTLAQRNVLVALGVGATFLLLSRLAWMSSIRKYSSAGG